VTMLRLGGVDDGRRQIDLRPKADNHLFSSATRTVLAVLAAAVTVMTLALSAAPANAAIGSMTAKLWIGCCYGHPPLGTSEVRLDGLVAMTKTEAQDVIDRGHKVVFRMWGDDPLSDDLQYGPHQIKSIYATEQGLKFNLATFRVNSAFDEDDSRFDDHDELYAGVRLVTSVSYDASHHLIHGPTVRSAETNRTGGYF
jgi:hypothetical protein